MSGPRSISAPAVLLAGVGAVAVWSALAGVSLGSGLRSLLGGAVPGGSGSVGAQLGASAAGAAGAAGAGVGPAAAGAVASSAVAGAAQRYLGSGSVYRWGGAKPTGWDCSGYCNWVIGHDLGLPIPGYPSGFAGAGHGPVTAQWAIWSGAVTIPRSQVQAGDLLVWPAVHMGIAVSATQMINCPGPNGTPAPVLDSIDGTRLGLLVCRRLRGGG
jgi:cell wall-associated NlpC family hydrolase